MYTNIKKTMTLLTYTKSRDQKTSDKPFNKKLGPIRNAYNVINNQKLP